jgi:acyl-CoA dehydrogenase family protein 9
MLVRALSSNVRRFASDTRKLPNKLDKAIIVPVDKSVMSPIRAAFHGDLASFNKNCVPFPVALSPEAKDTLSQVLEPVQKFFAKIPSAKIDADHAIPADVMNGLRELGLFGIQIGEEYGGLGLSNTSYARIAEEMSDASIAVTLMAHQSIGLKGILMFGTPEQKKKYLPRLASGEHIAAFALTEPQTGR